MSTRSGLPSGERTGEPSFISQIREELEVRKAMHEAMGGEADHSDTWNSEDFKRLPPEDQDALKREFGAAVEPRASIEDEKAVSEIREELETRKNFSEAVGNPPDFSDTWNSDAFKALSKEAQDALRAEFPGGAAAAEEPAKIEKVRRPEPSVPEQREKAKAKPARRVFESYGIAQSADAKDYQVIENYKEYDDEKEDYAAKKRRTRIVLPGQLIAAAEKKPGVLADISGYCEQLRRDLEQRGVKIYFDKPKDEPSKLQPKWKFYIEKKMFEEPIKPEDLPPEIMAMAKSDPQYYDRPAWKKWYGRMRQAKIEEVISGELAKMAADTAPRQETAPATPVTDEMIVDRETPGEAEAEEIIRGEKNAEQEKDMTEAAARKIVGDLIFSLSELYPLPEKLDTFLEHLQRFAGSFLEIHYRQRPDMAAAAKMSAEELASTIRAALRDHFSDRPEIQDALREAGPPVSGLRQEAERLRSDKDFGAFLKKLEKQAGDPDPEASQAALTLMNDIEHGRIGAAAELWKGGLKRTPKEQRFFDEHPLLDRRNVELMPDGRTIIYLDRMRADEALSRIVRLIVLDALAEPGRETGHDEDEELLIRQINAYVFKILGRKADELVAQRFKDSVAELDLQNGELIIKDRQKMIGIIRKLAEKLRKERE